MCGQRPFDGWASRTLVAAPRIIDTEATGSLFHRSYAGISTEVYHRMLRLRQLCFIVICLAALTLPATLTAQQPLTNDSVVQMTKAGLGDSLIIESINATPATFATSASDLIALKKAGVSERVIGAMIAKAGAPAAPVVPSPPGARTRLDAGDSSAATPPSIPSDLALDGVDEVGVYYKSHDGKWVPMEPELVNFRSGGAVKSYATDHLIKEDRNGHLMGPTAKLALTKQTEFLLYMPPGTAPVEFLLLKLRPGAQNGREFRSETGGVFHSSSGADRDRIVFDAARIAPRIYEFTLPASAAKGEYGILPPGSMGGSNAGYGGKIFTFKIVE